MPLSADLSFLKQILVKPKSFLTSLSVTSRSRFPVVIVAIGASDHMQTLGAQIAMSSFAHFSLIDLEQSSVRAFHES